ncbi:hypothetical protein BU17DRAFT_87262 [Hysterangium stoloniferum]|nr:hypothetical protein BU17DRAFT_87262 [Hysterangium stoloniferum]
MNYPDSTGYYDPSHPPPEQARKRLRQSSEDAPYIPDKREKARERQRRKRERDRAVNSALNVYPEGSSNANTDTQEYDAEGEASATFKRKSGGGRKVDLGHLPPEEAAKRERVRLAARERQRKHRASIKARRMAELGMAIVNEGGGIEQTAIGYTINENGQYEAVLADPGDPNLQHPQIPFPLPQAHATPGQMFASTLLLGLSCTPQLRVQLLRHVRASPEELAAFEPYMAAAFDHWDHGRSLHYAAQGQPAPSSQAPQGAPFGQTYPSFERFQRPLIQAFPPSPPPALEQSPSPSEEDNHRGHGESEARIEPQPTSSEQSSRIIRQTIPPPTE